MPTRKGVRGMDNHTTRGAELCSSCEILNNNNHCDCKYYDLKDDSPFSPDVVLFNYYYHNLTKYKIADFKPDRSYEGCANYLVVFAPLNNHVDKQDDIKKLEKYIRKFKYERVVITREILEKRVHYNMIVTTKENMMPSSGKIVQKFFMDVQHIVNSGHLQRVWNYIFKESKRRPFYANTDYFIYVKN